MFWTILTAILIVLLIVAAIIILFSISKINRLVNISKTLQSTTGLLTVIWSADLRICKLCPELIRLLEINDRKADKTFLFSLFQNLNTAEDSSTLLAINAISTKNVLLRLNDSNGKTCVIQWNSEIAARSFGRSLIITVGKDITETEMLKTSIEVEKNQPFSCSPLMTNAMNAAEIGLIAMKNDNYGMTLSLSQSARDILGIAPNYELTPEEFNRRIAPDDYSRFIRKFNKLLSNTVDSIDMSINMMLDEKITHNFIIKLRNCQSGYRDSNTIIGAFIDVSSEAKLMHIGHSANDIDSLTGFLNRNGFLTAANIFLRENNNCQMKIIMLCLKITRFQKITTLFGLDVGDKLLKLYAETILRCTSENSIVGKMSLEDFVILTDVSGIEEVEKFTKEMRIVIENFCNNQMLPSVLKEQSQFMAGGCFYDGIDDATTLYNKANLTLYTNKNIDGKNLILFNENIEKRVCERDIVAQEISDAIKHGELELYFQPKISFKTGEFVGAEALMRWNHPTRGLVPPIEFIPVAEEMGLITKIDEWGLAQACIQNKRWQNKGFHPISVSVNVSQAQLYQTDIVESIRRALSESQLDPKYLEVELTETMAMLDIERTVSILKQVKKLGVKISMDDFGTGYSSLSALKVLPIDIIKIDKSLVYDISESETSLNVTKAIVDLGKAMKLQVLAEGVETIEQNTLLEDLGCDIAQGFLYGKPQNTAEIERIYFDNYNGKKYIRSQQ